MKPFLIILFVHSFLFSFCQVSCMDTTNYYRLTKGKSYTASCDTMFIITAEKHKKIVASLDKYEKTTAIYNNIILLLKSQNEDFNNLNQKHKTYIDSLEVYNKSYQQKIEELSAMVKSSTQLTSQAIDKAKAYRRWNIAIGSVAVLFSGVSLGLLMLN